jgi:flagellar basal body rod protein FlgF
MLLTLAINATIISLTQQHLKITVNTVQRYKLVSISLPAKQKN